MRILQNRLRGNIHCTPALLLAAITTITTAQANAQTNTSVSVSAPTKTAVTQPSNTVSPVRRIDRNTNLNIQHGPLTGGQRTIDGSNNNLTDTELNMSHTSLRRMMQAKYADGISKMEGDNYPNPRAISNAVNAQPALTYNSNKASDYLWLWGQFLDHDIDLTDGTNPPENANISIPAGDPLFDPNATGTAELSFNRSIYQTNGQGPRQQLNEITGWIDGSQIYGSDEDRASALRTNDGTGRLRTSNGNLLPFNTNGLPNAGGNSAALFLAGDVRANEQTGLTVMHTLFVREHNRIAGLIAARDRTLGGEEIYQRARHLVIAELQMITYNEFLPLLLGPNALKPYRGYNPNVDARIMNEFSTAAFRLGHTLVSNRLLRLDAHGNEIPAGHLSLRNAFFSPHHIVEEGIEPVLRGLAQQRCQELDVYLVDDLRNFLFGQPGQGGFDLAALNIQRGRDHGLPRYNDAREYMGLARVSSFAQISSKPEIQQRLANVYNSVDDIDFWIGGLAEDHQPNAMVGELFYHVLKAQFEALRDGDRFWHKRYLKPKDRHLIANSRLSDIIRRNTSIGNEIAKDVFVVKDNLK